MEQEKSLVGNLEKSDKTRRGESCRTITNSRPPLAPFPGPPLPVDPGCPCVGFDSSPSRLQVLRSHDPLHHGPFWIRPMLPTGSALVHASPSGVFGANVRPVVGRFLSGLALHGDPSGSATTMAAADFPPRLRGSGSPQVRTRFSVAQRRHLSPGLGRTASLCCASLPRPGRPSMPFLFIRSRLLPSLPPAARLPGRP